MLSPTDVHYLVGFLSWVGRPDDVELELGSMVPDAASGESRDVDVTVTKRSSTGIECYRGIEVKAEKRPLDVAHVEQLCIKLNDMPDLTHRAIVSASGYTDQGRRKAASHGVELLRLDPWDRERQPLGGTVITPDFVWKNRQLKWQSPRVDFNIAWRGAAVPDTQRLRVLDSHGRRMKHVADLEAVARQVLKSTAEDASKSDPRIVSARADQPQHVFYNVDFADAFWVQRGRERGRVRGAVVTGRLVWSEEDVLPEFRILVQDGNNRPFVACALATMPNGDLAALAVRTEIAPVALCVVPISDRNKKRLHREKWPA